MFTIGLLSSYVLGVTGLDLSGAEWGTKGTQDWDTGVLSNRWPCMPRRALKLGGHSVLAFSWTPGQCLCCVAVDVRLGDMGGLRQCGQGRSGKLLYKLSHFSEKFKSQSLLHSEPLWIR